MESCVMFSVLLLSSRVPLEKKVKTLFKIRFSIFHEYLHFS